MVLVRQAAAYWNKRVHRHAVTTSKPNVRCVIALVLSLTVMWMLPNSSQRRILILFAPPPGAGCSEVPWQHSTQVFHRSAVAGQSAGGVTDLLGVPVFRRCSTRRPTRRRGSSPVLSGATRDCHLAVVHQRAVRMAATRTAPSAVAMCRLQPFHVAWFNFGSPMAFSIIHLFQVMAPKQASCCNDSTANDGFCCCLRFK